MNGTLFTQAFWAVVILAALLVSLNVHSVFKAFLKDKDRAKLVVYLGAFVLFGIYLIRMASTLMDQAMETDRAIHMDSTEEVQIAKFPLPGGRLLAEWQHHRHLRSTAKGTAPAPSTAVPG